MTSATALRRLRVTGPRTVARTPGRCGRAALGFYRPQSWKGQALALLSRWAVDTPAGVLLDVDPVLRRHLDALLAAVGGDEAGAAVLASSRPGRWIVGLARDRELTAVAKVATCTDPGLDVEAHLLSRRPSGATWRSPRVLAELSGPGVLVTEPVRGSCEMDPAVVLAICRDLQRTSLVHGDLAPWNILATGDGAVVLDWETARLRSFEPGRDLIHYHTKRSLLLDGKPAGFLVTELLDDEGWLTRLLEPTGVSCEDAVAAYALGDHPGDLTADAVAYRRSMLASLHLQGRHAHDAAKSLRLPGCSTRASTLPR